MGADSEEKHEPVSNIDTAAADSLKVLDPKRPIREADIGATGVPVSRDSIVIFTPNGLARARITMNLISDRAKTQIRPMSTKINRITITRPKPPPP
jgi:hypothetical protein